MVEVPDVSPVLSKMKPTSGSVVATITLMSEAAVAEVVAGGEADTEQMVGSSV